MSMHRSRRTTALKSQNLPKTYVAGLYPKYLDNSMISDYRFDHHSYGSFISGGSTPNTHHEIYTTEKVDIWL